MQLLDPSVSVEAFFDAVRDADNRVLLLDYDGTCAPFRERRDEAFPYPDVREVLEALLAAKHSRVVLISGRAVDDLLPLLQLEHPPEIWGNHGWERRKPDGAYETAPLPPGVRDALASATAWIEAQGLSDESERKPASVTLHWRAAPPDEQQRRKEAAAAAWRPLVDQAAVELHHFDGGLELRATGRNKGTAVAEILAEVPRGAVVAYAGDDQTDEDAFAALEGRGLRVLVRAALRETAADVQLTPPDEFVRFLNDWHRAAMGESTGEKGTQE